MDVKNYFVNSAMVVGGFLPSEAISNTVSTLREDERRGRREVDVEYQCRCRVGGKEKTRARGRERNKRER